MGRRLVALLAAPLVLGASLLIPDLASGAQVAAPMTLDVAVPGAFGGCDPGSPSTTAPTDAVLSLVLPSAFTSGLLDAPTGDTSAIASAEIVDPDPQTVVYTIATGAQWPDGTPFTAADLVRTWQERRDDRVLADLGYRDIAYMHPSATGTAVTVGFTTPYADWESLFNLVVPATTSGAHCAEPSAALDPSIGPYAIASATSTQIDLAANPAWTGEPLAFPRVVVTAGLAATTAPTDALRAIDLPGASLAAIQAVSSSGALDAKVSPSATIVSLDFAVRGAHALSLGVRTAVAQLIDRQQILDQVVGPIDYTGVVADSHLFGPGQQGYAGTPGTPMGLTPATPATPVAPGATGSAAYGMGPSVSAATSALVLAGYTRPRGQWVTSSGHALALCLAVPIGHPVLSAAAADVESDLETEGIEVSIESIASAADAASALSQGACAMAIVSRTADGFITHEAANWVAPTPPVPASLTWTGVDDPIVDADATAASQTLNPVAATTSWAALDSRLWDLMASLPLYSPPTFEAWSPEVAGVLPCTSVQEFVDQIPELLYAPIKS